MDPSVNYSLMVQERGKYPAQHFHLNCFFNLQDQNMRSRYWWPGLSHFLENAISAIPTQSLSIYASTLLMWFQERNVMRSVQAYC